MAKAKQEFDKDYIFNLIMPTAAPEPEEAPTPPEPEATPEAPRREPERDSLTLLKDRLRAQPQAPGVRLKPARDLVLVNLMEQMVSDRLDGAFDKFNCCHCDKCKRDAAALALNALPPRYVVADPDELPALLEECSSKEVSSAIVKAILYVKGHPKH